MSPVISIEGLTVQYGKHRAVDDLNLTVDPGEVVGFLGPNGAGKTTTIRALLDLLRADSGTLRIFDLDPREAAGDLRRRMGFLPGDLALFPHLTGRQNLDFFARLFGRGSPRRELVLERLGFRMDALNRKLREYSTGMRQMIGIAIAFQHEPELFVLDEPTTGLDPLVREAFLQLVKEVAEEGRTVLFSSHVLGEVEYCADRVALINRGRLATVETVEDFRHRLPRTVSVLDAEGQRQRFPYPGSPRALMEELAVRGLEEGEGLEVRAADLNEVFRSMVREGAGS